MLDWLLCLWQELFRAGGAPGGKQRSAHRPNRGGLLLFREAHLKLQGDVTNAHDQSKEKSDDQIYRLQAQVIF